MEETIQETSLPKPQNNIHVVTALPPKKKQRSEKQIQWSRELGRRSQEFKRKKYTMQNATHNATITSLPELPANKLPEPKQNTSNNRSYLVYLFLIGGTLAGGYYFIYKKRIIAPEPQPVKLTQTPALKPPVKNSILNME